LRLPTAVPDRLRDYWEKPPVFSSDVVEESLVDLDFFDHVGGDAQGKLLEEIREAIAVDQLDGWCSISR
jgi:hypothetical protein